MGKWGKSYIKLHLEVANIMKRMKVKNVSLVHVDLFLTPVGSHLETRGVMCGAVKCDLKFNVRYSSHLELYNNHNTACNTYRKRKLCFRPLPAFCSPFNLTDENTARLPYQS